MTTTWQDVLDQAFIDRPDPETVAFIDRAGRPRLVGEAAWCRFRTMLQSGTPMTFDDRAEVICGLLMVA